MARTKTSIKKLKRQQNELEKKIRKQQQTILQRVKEEETKIKIRLGEYLLDCYKKRFKGITVEGMMRDVQIDAEDVL